MAQEKAGKETSEQILDMFGALLPHRTEGMDAEAREPKAKKPRSASPSKEKHASASARRASTGRSSGNNMENLTVALAKLALRQEDQLNRHRLDTSYLLYVQTKAKILGSMFEVSKSWKARRESGSIRMDIPLRLVLLQVYLQELLHSVRVLCEESDTSRSLRDKGEFVRQIWNPQTEKLETTEGTIHPKDVMKMIAEMTVDIANPDVILRFHSSRPLAEEFRGGTLLFFLEVSVRSPAANRVYNALLQLVDMSLWSLLYSQLRKPGLKRSPLATEIQSVLGTVSKRT